MGLLSVFGFRSCLSQFTFARFSTTYVVVDKSKHIDFENTASAFKSKSNLKLLQNLAVFQLCSVNYLVDNNIKLMNLAKKILGKSVFDKLMRGTFYGQFIAGQDSKEVLEVVNNLRKFGVSSTLNYSSEGDLANEMYANKHSSAGESKIKRAMSAKYYDPAERQLDANLNSYLDSLELTFDIKSDCNAIKLTSLIRPELLSKLSQLVLFANQRQSKYNQLFNWTSLVNKNENELFKHFEPILVESNAKIEINEFGEMSNFVRRIDLLAQSAKEKKIKMFIDAEQTYFNPMISRVVIELMRVYNRNSCVILNTYQNYLKDTFDRLKSDVKIASDEDFHFGCKLVRGAYIVQERSRAKQMGYADPVNEDFEATSRMYEKSLTHCLEQVKLRSGKVFITIASHNEDTVRFAVNKLQELNIEPKNSVAFGQLLGMVDYITYNLASAGLPVYKWLAYGPIDEVLPFLSRRAVENRGIFDKVKKEKRLIKKELKRRLFGFI